MRTPPLFLLFLFVSAPVPAQDAMPPTAMRVTASPVVDGRLNEPAWETAKPITAFRQQEPVEGELSTEPTDVRIVYQSLVLKVTYSVHR